MCEQMIPPPLGGICLSEVEKTHIKTVLRDCLYHKPTAAKILGISLKTLYNKLNLYSSEEILASSESPSTHLESPDMTMTSSNRTGTAVVNSNGLVDSSYPDDFHLLDRPKDLSHEAIWVSEVRFKRLPPQLDQAYPNNRLLAFCSITLNRSFVIRDVKIINGNDGLFVAMPSRKLTDKCKNCGFKNHLRSRFCNECGYSHKMAGILARDNGLEVDTHFYSNVAHPCSDDARSRISDAVLSCFHEGIA